MFGKLGDMAGLFKQAQEVQKKMEAMQAELADKTIEGQSGAGLVKVVMTLKGDMVSLFIDPELVRVEEKDILEDLITAAVNDAKSKADQKSSQSMEKITGGLNLPEGFKLPF